MKVFLDSASLADIATYDADSMIDGVTTNPSLLKKAGVSQYEAWARHALSITEKPISLEVISDDPSVMARQARQIASWGENAIVKIPVTTTQGRATHLMIQDLLREGISINVTAIFTLDQIYEIGSSLASDTASIVSIFAGRISDTGKDPVPIVKETRELFECSNTEVLWASPRSVFDFYRAMDANADIITMTTDLISKLDLWNYDLAQYSLDTITQFHRDAMDAGLTL
jgi:transaldolase